MKLREYIRLGKISIKSRKKSTRNTVRGISFGLIMLVPIVFFTLAFYLDLTDKINQTKNISSFYFDAVGENSQQDGSFENYTLLFGNSDVGALEKRVGEEVEDIVYSQNYTLSNDGGESGTVLEIDGVRKTGEWFRNSQNYGSSSDQLFANANLKVIDRERSNGKLFPDGFKSDLEEENRQIYAAGGAFSENGRGEIIISEMIANMFGLSPTAAIGTKVTLTASGSFSGASSFSNSPNGYYLDNDTNPGNTYAPSSDGDEYMSNNFKVDILHEFTVVGVVSKEYFALNSFLRSDANLWISEDSVYETANGEKSAKYLPSLRTGETETDYGDKQYYQVVTYPKTGIEGIQSLAEQAAEEKMFFPAIPAIRFSSSRMSYMNNYAEEPYTSVVVQCKNYQSASKIETLLNNSYTRISGEDTSAFGGYVKFNCTTDSYQNFSMLHQVGSYLMVIMYTFGGIIFFATLLNLYNSVNYSVQARRNYIGMMRAIGAKQKVIPKLYFVEILLIFWRSFWWVLIIGGGISYGIKALIDLLFRQEDAAMLGAKISLNFAWFFASLAAVIAVVFLIAFLFSRVACRSVTKKGILEVLSDDK